MPLKSQKQYDEKNIVFEKPKEKKEKPKKNKGKK